MPILDLSFQGGSPVAPSDADSVEGSSSSSTDGAVTASASASVVPFVTANSTFAVLRLDQFASNGCEILYFVVEYRARTVVSNAAWITGINYVTLCVFSFLSLYYSGVF